MNGANARGLVEAGYSNESDHVVTLAHSMVVETAWVRTDNCDLVTWTAALVSRIITTLTLVKHCLITLSKIVVVLF